jgi:hypothetical protein
MGAFPMEDKIPRLEKFCFCMDLKTGVKVGAIVLVIYYVIVLIAGVTGGNTGNSIFAVILCLVNVAAFGLVLYALQKEIAKFMLPAIFLCLIDVIIGVVWGIIQFITIVLWISGLFSLASAALTAYFFIALKNVYDDMGNASAPAPPAETKPENPA